MFSEALAVFLTGDALTGDRVIAGDLLLMGCCWVVGCGCARRNGIVVVDGVGGRTSNEVFPVDFEETRLDR